MTAIDWSATWAGVQGIAAVGALAFVVVQVTRDGRARRAKDRAILVAAYKATWLAMVSVEAWSNADHSRTTPALAAQVLLTTSHLVPMLAELRSIPIHEMPSPSAVTALLKVRSLLALIVAEAEHMVTSVRRRPAFPEDGMVGLIAVRDDLLSMCMAAGVSASDLELPDHLRR